MRWYQRPGLPILVSAFVAVLAAWVAQLATHDVAEQLTLGLVAGVAALLVIGLWQSHSRSPLVAKLEESLIDEQLYRSLDRIITANGRLAERLNAGPDCAALFAARKAEVLVQAANAMERMATGKLVFTDPDQHDRTLIDLVGLARGTVLAISYRDDEFWASDLGEEYLDGNRRLIEKRGEVHRIFVLASEQMLERARPAIERQIRLGIRAHILPPIRQAPTDHEDFVVVDEAFVRHAEPVEFAGSRKRATLSIDPVDVTRYTLKFHDMLLRCQPAEAYFGVQIRPARTDKPPAASGRRAVKASAERALSAAPAPLADAVLDGKMLEIDPPRANGSAAN